MIAPTASMLWIFADEHPNSINDNTLVFQCALQGRFAIFVDYPASYHNQSGSFSFADGHVEIHKWTGQAIQLPVYNSGGGGPFHSNPANDSADDLAWIQIRTSAK